MLVLCDVEEVVLVDGRSRSLALKLEDHDTIVVTGSEEVDLWMSGNDPEAVVLALERLDRSAFVQIPDAQSLVLADGENQVLVRVEQTAGSVLEVATASIDFPSLGLAHSP